MVSLLPLYDVVFSSALTTTGQTPVFATWQGSGPDKWASIWLIERYIAPGTQVQLIEMNATADDAVMFDVPDSPYKQTGQQTTFDTLRLAWMRGDFNNGVAPHKKQQSTVTLINQLLNDIELNTWQPDELEQSIVLEYAYRDLQNEFQRNQVPKACYTGLFDRLADGLIEQGLSSLRYPDGLRPAASCLALEEVVEAVPLVREISTQIVADYIRRHQKVVFVDVREEPEFNEVRIPGARNIQIRNVDQAVLDSLAEADLIVSYCVKDFRGYEMALKLAKAGVENSAIMNPYGINGWITAGLPVYKGTGSEARSIDEMNNCLLNNCMETRIAEKESFLPEREPTML